ncbi:MAG: thioredoxin domain-containing protein [Chloroflexi bacterium]|nr:thioredoxin domain-containing protein [Chloroflexota bacterium]
MAKEKESNKPKTTSKPPQKTAPRITSRSGTRASERRKEGERTGGRTVERRKERERERQRQRLITYGVIIGAVVAVIVIIFLIVNAPAGAPIPEGALTRYDGIQQSHTTEGFPRLGDPGASVQVAEYASFGCPHCRDFNTAGTDQILERVKTGKMAFTYVPLYGFGDVANDQGAAAAAMCADEQDKFWPFHDALFDWQGEFGNQAFTNNRINAGVAAFSLNQGDYSACISSGKPGTVLAAANQSRVSLLNFSGTPTFTINGVVPLDDNQQPISDTNAIFARIDQEIARLASQPTPQVTAEVTSEATAEATQASTPVSAATAEATVTSTAETTAESTPAS